MFGIGFFELVVIAVVALVFVGPSKLPQVMRQFGRFFVQVRQTANEVRDTFDGVIRDAENDLRREQAETVRQLYAASAEKTRAETDFTDDGHNPDGTLKDGYVPGHDYHDPHHTHHDDDGHHHDGHHHDGHHHDGHHHDGHHHDDHHHDDHSHNNDPLPPAGSLPLEPDAPSNPQPTGTDDTQDPDKSR